MCAVRKLYELQKRSIFKFKICTRHLNSETLDLGDGLRHFCMFTKEDKGLLLTAGHISGPDHTDELDNDFAVQEVNRFILGVKITKR